MSSVLDVPVQLVVALALAVSPADDDGNREPLVFAASSVPATVSRTLETQAPAGAFLMTEQAWLAAFASHAPEQPLARRIYKTTSGRLYVPMEADRQDILVLRRDEQLAAVLTSRMARDNRTALTQHLHRLPTAGELYIAHLFGADAALRLIERRDLSDRDAEALRTAGIVTRGLTGPDAARLLRLAVDIPLERAATAAALTHLRPAAPEGGQLPIYARGRMQEGQARAEIRR